MFRFLKSVTFAQVIAALLLTTASAFQASATESGYLPDSLTSIMSYNELMALSESARAEYLKGVREMIVELSKDKGARSKSLFAEVSQDSGSLARQLALLDALFPIAMAAPPTCRPGQTQVVITGTNAIGCGIMLVTPSSNRSACPPDMIQVNKSGNSWGCVVPATIPEDVRKRITTDGILGPAPAAAASPAAAPAPARSWWSGRGTPSVADIVPEPRGRIGSMFNNAPACGGGLVQHRVQAQTRLTAQGGSFGYICREPDAPLYQETCKPDFVAILPQANGTFLCGTRASVNDLPDDLRRSVRSARIHVDANKNIMEVNERFNKNCPNPTPDAKCPAPSQPAQAANAAPAAQAAAARPGQTTPAPGAPNAQGTSNNGQGPAQNCGEQGPACSTDTATIQKHRDDFYKKPIGSSYCVYAGNMSVYNARAPSRANRCEPKRRFEIAAGAPDLECRAPLVLCNPLVFGYKKEAGKSEGICVGASGDATSACDTQAGRITNLAYPLLENGPVANQWNEFATRFNGICHGDPDAKVFFCGECQIIRTRLFRLNAVVRNQTNCAQALNAAERRQAPAGAAGTPPPQGGTAPRRTGN